MFEQMYQRLESELGVKRKDMARLLDEVGKVYSDRDAVVAKLQEAQRVRDAQIREMGDSEVNKVESGEDDEAFQIGDRKLNDIERLQSAFRSRGMGELTTDEMADKFIQQEDNNFQLFTDVNQLKHQTDAVETEIINLQGTLDHLLKSNAKNTTNQAMVELDDKLSKARDQKAKLDDEIKKIKEEIDAVLLVIKSLSTETLHLEAELQTALIDQPIDSATRDNY